MLIYIIMYYWLKCNNFSKIYLPFKNYRFCIENILNLNIHFKNLNELNKDDTLIIFSYDIFNPKNILDDLIKKPFKILIINTENYKFKNIINMFQKINNINNIYLIEYNIVNIHYIKENYKNINLNFLPLLYNPYLENIYQEKYIPFNNKKTDILFCGTLHLPRRKKLLDSLRKKFNITINSNCGDINKQNKELANAKIVLNIYSYEHNKIFDYYRNSYLLANKCLLISEYPENIDLSIEKNLIGYKENLIFFKYDECEKVLEKYLHLSEEEYQSIVNKQYEWFKKQNNMKDYTQGIF
jgi:hypothetical protein